MGSGGISGISKNAAKPYASGGIIDEFIYGVGASGKTYTFGEDEPEIIVPLSKFTNASTILNKNVNSAINNAFFAGSSDTRAESSDVTNYYDIKNEANTDNSNISIINYAKSLLAFVGQQASISKVVQTTDKLVQQMNTYFGKSERVSETSRFDKIITNNNSTRETNQETARSITSFPTKDLHIHLEIDGREIARATVNDIDEMLTDKGKQVLRGKMQTPLRFS
jgi:hypothetical protein